MKIYLKDPVSVFINRKQKYIIVVAAYANNHEIILPWKIFFNAYKSLFDVL